MRADHFDRLKELFESAVQLDDAARPAFIEQACGDDAALRTKLEGLLRSIDATVGVADPLSDQRIDEERARIDRMLASDSRNPLPEIVTGSPRLGEVPAGHPQAVGRYRLRRHIASGGMGSVYEAEQDSPQRRVALKMVHRGRMTPAVMKRLQQESEILGRLQHPGIAQVFDAGEADLGDGTQPFFAMEFIDGVALTKYCAQQHLDDRARLELLASICDAVQYAHDKGVIHRDLKPDNILVDAHGHPKILDFGIARVTDESGPAAMTMTQEGQILGTLAYMAPEQLDPSASSGQGGSTITQRADVYALGVIGFELLAGRRPHDLAGKSTSVALRWLAENDPPKLASIDARFRGDVQTIVDKALQRDPNRRYDSAAALAADIRRHLAHEPILAAPPSNLYIAGRFIRRHRGLVGGAAAVFIVLVGGIVTSTLFAFRADAAREETARKVQELEQVAGYQEEQLTIDPAAMGIRMFDELIAMYRGSLQQSDMDADDVDSDVAAFTEALSRINFTTYAALTVEHNVLDQSLEAIDEQFADQPVVRARLLYAMAATFERLGLQDRTQDLYAEALRLRRAWLGNEHPDTLASMVKVFEASVAQSPEEAQALIQEAVDGLTLHYGENHPLTLAARNLCWRPAAWLGQEAEANAMRLETLRRATTYLDAGHPVALNARFLTPGTLPEEEAMLRELLETSRSTHGPDHPVTVHYRDRLGNFLRESGGYAEAEQIYRANIAWHRERHGERHPRTITAIGKLGTLLEIMDRLEEAEALLTAANKAAVHRGLKRWFLAGNLGFLQYKLGRYEEAEANIQLSLQLRRERGEHLNSLLALQSNLALVLADAGKAEEGERLARRVLEASVRRDLEVKRAESLNRYNATMATTRARAHLGRALYQLGRYAEAEAELLEAYENSPIKDNHVTRRTADFLVDLYEAWHEAEPGKGYDGEAAKWRE